MTKLKWNEITSEDVINAIYAFEFERPDYPAAKSTFLIYNGKKYPAKHIRGMAYKIHFGVDISKNDYAGGKETEMLFKKLGFEVQYTHKSVITHPVIHKTNPPKLPSPNKSYLKIITREAVEPVSSIHDRMPLILKHEDVRDWVRPSTSPGGIVERALIDVIMEVATV